MDVLSAADTKWKKAMDVLLAAGRIVIALDGLKKERCWELVSQLMKSSAPPRTFKIHDLWDREGPQVVRELVRAGAPWVWADLKLKDIPVTVGHRARAVRDAGATMLTVHASGGVEMMQSAVENGPPWILAVTALTSLSEEEVHLLHGQPVKAAVLYQARLAKLAGVRGIVCSPQEVAVLAERPELKGLEFFTPGIRPAGQDAADQKRVHIHRQVMPVIFCRSHRKYNHRLPGHDLFDFQPGVMVITIG